MAIDDNPSDGVYYASEEYRSTAHISSIDEYTKLYLKSVSDPEGFWMEIANHFFWKRWPQEVEVVSYNFDVTKGPVCVKWLDGCQTNMSYNVLDLCVNKGLGNRVAYYWESNDDKSHKQITYNELLRDVCKFANVLKGLGIKRGDRVAVYMSVTIELVTVMLACARIGAIHSVISVFVRPVFAMAIDDNPSDGVYYASEEYRSTAHISSIDEYTKLYQKSVSDPEGFWMEIANHFFWKRWPQEVEVVSYNFDVTKGPVCVKWLDGCQTNMSYNVLDLCVNKGLGDRVAYYWESNDDKSHKQITYNELLRDVCKFANVLKGLGIKRGDRVAVYMSVTIELVTVMLACARIGAIHSVIIRGTYGPIGSQTMTLKSKVEGLRYEGI
ncbi:unnamed protein product [Medioppia subpectinata]|uniref:acetate--CoA ligase n=1 Tax=Medioppia subpectinata TaxID=1979941 RepID=A0A7R9KYC9_9ACAR|nr:unnamed protein product [Medioppia subpectinata]CAG2112143.1 unnamed protein product [Medioppia subpectinata]